MARKIPWASVGWPTLYNPEHKRVGDDGLVVTGKVLAEPSIPDWERALLAAVAADLVHEIMGDPEDPEPEER